MPLATPEAHGISALTAKAGSHHPEGFPASLLDRAAPVSSHSLAHADAISPRSGNLPLTCPNLPCGWRHAEARQVLHNPWMPSSPSPDFALSAWIDESVIVGVAGAPGTYTMAAVVADSSDAECIRQVLRELTVRPGVRLH